MNWLVWPLLASLALGLFYALEGWVSGWSALAGAYPAGGEDVTRVYRFESGEMGWMWQFNGALTLAACEQGLRVSTWLRRPFIVPWSQIQVEQRGGLVRPMTQLVFGAPEVGRLRIASKTWDALSESTSKGA